MNHHPTSIRPCQHVRVNGAQCGSPALKGRRLCFFHNRLRQTRIDFNQPSAQNDGFELPMLEDADSIQVTLVQVLRLVISQRMDPKTAGLVLYGLQTASFNLKRTNLQPAQPEAATPSIHSRICSAIDDEAGDSGGQKQPGAKPTHGSYRKGVRPLTQQELDDAPDSLAKRLLCRLRERVAEQAAEEKKRQTDEQPSPP